MTAVAVAEVEQREEWYGSPETCARTGLSYRRLYHLIELGVIRSAVEPTGSGRPLRFTRHVVERLAIANALHNSMPGARQSDAWTHLARAVLDGPEPTGTWVICNRDGEISYATDDDAVFAALELGGALITPISALLRD